MASKLQKKNGKWTFRYLADEKHKRYICEETASYQEAEQERIDFLSALKALKNKKDETKILWKDFFNSFLNYVKRNKKTAETYILHINNFNNVFKITYLDEVNTAKFNEYIDIRLKAGITKSTINRELNTFRMMFTWAIDIEDFAIKHPLKKKIKKFRTKTVVKTRVLNKDEVIKLFSCIRDNADEKGHSLGLERKMRDMIATLLYCGLYAGLRLKEAKMLKRKDILFNESSILIEPQKTSESDPNIVTIPLATKLKDYLIYLFKQYPDESYAVPNIDENDRKSRSAVISHLIVDTLKRIGIQAAGMHTCRHTFISNLANNPEKIDSVDIMEYARIRSIEVLKVYRHITPETHRANIDKLTY